MTPDRQMIEAAQELAEYASYAEIVGGVSKNRPQIREWCDKVFALLSQPAAKPSDTNDLVVDLVIL